MHITYKTYYNTEPTPIPRLSSLLPNTLKLLYPVPHHYVLPLSSLLLVSSRESKIFLASLLLSFPWTFSRDTLRNYTAHHPTRESKPPLSYSKHLVAYRSRIKLASIYCILQTTTPPWLPSVFLELLFHLIYPSYAFLVQCPNFFAIQDCRTYNLTNHV